MGVFHRDPQDLPPAARLLARLHNRLPLPPIHGVHLLPPSVSARQTAQLGVAAVPSSVSKDSAGAEESVAGEAEAVEVGGASDVGGNGQGDEGSDSAAGVVNDPSGAVPAAFDAAPPQAVGHASLFSVREAADSTPINAASSSHLPSAAVVPLEYDEDDTATSKLFDTALASLSSGQASTTPAAPTVSFAEKTKVPECNAAQTAPSDPSLTALPARPVAPLAAAPHTRNTPSQAQPVKDSGPPPPATPKYQKRKVPPPPPPFVQPPKKPAGAFASKQDGAKYCAVAAKVNAAPAPKRKKQAGARRKSRKQQQQAKGSDDDDDAHGAADAAPRAEHSSWRDFSLEDPTGQVTGGVTVNYPVERPPPGQPEVLGDLPLEVQIQTYLELLKFNAEQQKDFNLDLPLPSREGAESLLYLSPILPLSIIGPFVPGSERDRYFLQPVSGTPMTYDLAARILNFVSNYVYLIEVYAASPETARKAANQLVSDEVRERAQRLGLDAVWEECERGFAGRLKGKAGWRAGLKAWLFGYAGWSEGRKYAKTTGRTHDPRVYEHFVTFEKGVASDALSFPQFLLRELHLIAAEHPDLGIATFVSFVASVDGVASKINLNLQQAKRLESVLSACRITPGPFGGGNTSACGDVSSPNDALRYLSPLPDDLQLGRTFAFEEIPLAVRSHIYRTLPQEINVGAAKEVFRRRAQRPKEVDSTRTVDPADRNILLKRAKAQPVQQPAYSSSGLESIGALRPEDTLSRRTQRGMQRQPDASKDDLAQFRLDTFDKPLADLLATGRNSRTAETYGAVVSRSSIRAGVVGELAGNQPDRPDVQEMRLVLAHADTVMLVVVCVVTKARGMVDVYFDDDDDELCFEQEGELVQVRRRGARFRDDEEDDWALTKKKAKESFTPRPVQNQDYPTMNWLFDRIL
ncbi:hypothetical protein JCM10213_004688 [Rhodosporidiobolus nylandii]